MIYVSLKILILEYFLSLFLELAFIVFVYCTKAIIMGSSRKEHKHKREKKKKERKRLRSESPESDSRFLLNFINIFVATK